MKLCVLKSKIESKPLYEYEELYLYHIPIDEYKKCILKGIVSTSNRMNADACYMYAALILKGKFDIGEEYISKDAMFSGRYACEVLEGKFELGESIISTDTHFSYLYARDALKGRFELGEAVISELGVYGFRYAIDVTKERFLLGERSIEFSGYGKEYEEYFNIKL